MWQVSLGTMVHCLEGSSRGTSFVTNLQVCAGLEQNNVNIITITINHSYHKPGHLDQVTPPTFCGLRSQISSGTSTMLERVESWQSSSPSL